MKKVNSMKTLVSWCRDTQHMLGIDTQFQLWEASYGVGVFSVLSHEADGDGIKIPKLVGEVLSYHFGLDKHRSKLFSLEDLMNIPSGRLDYHTYIIQALGTDMVKIGRSIDVHKRLKQLQTGQASKLHLAIYFPYDIEAELHQLFKTSHVRGEWYRYQGKVLKFLELNAGGYWEQSTIETWEEQYYS